MLDKKQKKTLRRILAEDGESLLSAWNLFEQVGTVVDDFLHEVGRVAVEVVLDLSAQQVAGPKHQGAKGEGKITWHGTQGGEDHVIGQETLHSKATSEKARAWQFVYYHVLKEVKLFLQIISQTRRVTCPLPSTVRTGSYQPAPPGPGGGLLKNEG